MVVSTRPQAPGLGVRLVCALIHASYCTVVFLHIVACGVWLICGIGFGGPVSDGVEFGGPVALGLADPWGLANPWHGVWWPVGFG